MKKSKLFLLFLKFSLKKEHSAKTLNDLEIINIEKQQIIYKCYEYEYL